MRFLDNPVTSKEIKEIRKEFGDYIKLTIDIENECLVLGSELHADGEKLLLDKGSLSDNIWGGGINLKEKEIDTTAVLNLRSRLENNSLEILDVKRRNIFIKVVKRIFQILWA